MTSRRGGLVISGGVTRRRINDNGGSGQSGEEENVMTHSILWASDHMR